MSAMSRRSCSSSTRSRTRRTSGPCSGAPRRPASTASSSRPRRQAPLSAAAVKASAGATEHLLLCPVDDLPGALADLHAARSADRRIRGGCAADRASDRPARPARDRRRERGSGSRARHPATLRPVHADPDARRDRVAQRRGRRVRASVRGGRPARPGRADARPRKPTPEPSSASGTDAGSDAAANRRQRRARAARARRSRPPTTPAAAPRARRPRHPRKTSCPGGPPTEPAAETAEAADTSNPPRLTHQRERPYHSPAPSGVSCGMSLRVAPT